MCDGVLPASRLVACASARSAARQPTRSITVAKMSARLDITCSPLAEIAPQCPGYPSHTARGGHLLADYRANGSALATPLTRSRHFGISALLTGDYLASWNLNQRPSQRAGG